MVVPSPDPLIGAGAGEALFMAIGAYVRMALPLLRMSTPRLLLGRPEGTSVLKQHPLAPLLPPIAMNGVLLGLANVRGAEQTHVH